MHLPAEAVARIQPVRAAAGAALIALDYDGTLAPIAERPQDARPAPGAVDALRRCAEVVGTVAIVTGRPALGPVELAGLHDVKGLTVIGHYGAQRWTAEGGLVSPPEHPGIAVARRLLPEALAAAPPGVRIEDKGLSLAVHTRQCADPEAALEDIVPALSAIVAETGLEVEHGRLVVDLRPPGATDKGTALRRLVAECQPRAVLFAGDDTVDLPAFDVVADLRQRGTPAVAVFVDNPEAPPILRECADLVLPGVGAMVRLLEELARE